MCADKELSSLHNLQDLAVRRDVVEVEHGAEAHRDDRAVLGGLHEAQLRLELPRGAQRLLRAADDVAHRGLGGSEEGEASEGEARPRLSGPGASEELRPLRPTGEATLKRRLQATR